MRTIICKSTKELEYSVITSQSEIVQFASGDGEQNEQNQDLNQLCFVCHLATGRVAAAGLISHPIKKNYHNKIKLGRTKFCKWKMYIYVHSALCTFLYIYTSIYVCVYNMYMKYVSKLNCKFNIEYKSRQGVCWCMKINARNIFLRCEFESASQCKLL